MNRKGNIVLTKARFPFMACLLCYKRGDEGADVRDLQFNYGNGRDGTTITICTECIKKYFPKIIKKIETNKQKAK